MSQLKIGKRERHKDESIEQYHARLRQENKDIKDHLQGTCFWFSPVFGTYRSGDVPDIAHRMIKR